ncbi:hypothetical protein ACLB2K_044467 [Fragaria x ananassa]
MSRVMVKGDALNVLNGLTHGWDLSEIGGVLDAVRVMMRAFEVVSWKHVKKRLNIVVHRLARSALTRTQAMYCRENGPEWLHELVDVNRLSEGGLC